MNELDKIKERHATGYTMARYGTMESIFRQMESDITALLEIVDKRQSHYLFWFEHEGKDGWTFEIDAKDYDEAYEKAYAIHGPQVEGMMYELL